MTRWGSETEPLPLWRVHEKALCRTCLKYPHCVAVSDIWDSYKYVTSCDSFSVLSIDSDNLRKDEND